MSLQATSYGVLPLRLVSKVIRGGEFHQLERLHSPITPTDCTMHIFEDNIDLPTNDVNPDLGLHVGLVPGDRAFPGYGK
jgi:hypothetical protein